MFEDVEVQGTFDPQKFYDTLARILSQKFDMDLTVKVIQEEKANKLKGASENAI